MNSRRTPVSFIAPWAMVVLSCAGSCLVTVGQSEKIPPTDRDAESRSDWAPHPGPPPIKRFYGPSTSPEFLSFPGCIGEVVYHARKPEVKILWESRATKAFLAQTMELSCWPTWVLTSADGTQMIVGGKQLADGNTVIERYTLSEPRLVKDDRRPGKQMLLSAKIHGIERIYEGAIEGMDYVRAIVAMRGVDDAYLVRFDDSGDVHTFRRVPSTDSWDHELVASSASADPDVLIAPGLSLMTIDAWTADHSTAGFLYCFGQSSTLKPHKTILLSDADRDGTLDHAATLTTDEWNASVYKDSDGYVSLKK